LQSQADRVGTGTSWLTMLRRMIDALGLWRGLERAAGDRGLEWGVNYAPAQLRYARTADHPHGARLEHLLPADYRAFVAELGYPVVGFKYYDRRGISFLPPEAMACISVNLPDPDDEWPEAVEGEPTVCRHAFFAGNDLSDIEGYSFGPSSDGNGLVVWLVEGGMPREECGTFSEWLEAEVARLTQHVSTFEPAPREQTGADETGADEGDGEEYDPHRLLDYSLYGDYSQAPYTAADLALTWVESDTGSYSNSYGLIDATGTWLIPISEEIREVRPFRDGVAEVVLNKVEPGHGVFWSKIRTDGSVIEP
jgi:hypothetical protein